jgi:hypothetical protein
MESSDLTITAGALYVLQKLSARPLEELSELLADRVRLWRFRNQIAILEETADYVTKYKLHLNELPLKTLLPMLEGASAEEEPLLRTLWARLIANASASAAPVSISGIATEILKALSQNDARVLQALFDEVHTALVGKGMSWGNYQGMPRAAAEPRIEGPHRLVSRARLMEVTKIDLVDFEVSFDNITRFNVIEAPQRHDLDGRELDRDYYAFTRLGWRVMSLLSTEPPSPKPSTQ